MATAYVYQTDLEEPYPCIARITRATERECEEVYDLLYCDDVTSLTYTPAFGASGGLRSGTDGAPEAQV